MDKQEGQGKKLYIDGSSYEGAWKVGKFHGQGTMVYGESAKTLIQESLANKMTDSAAKSFKT